MNYVINFSPKKKQSKDVYSQTRTGHTVKYGEFSKFGAKSGIYSITCKVNNKSYIGSTKNIQLRLGKHFSELRLNRHRAKELQKDYNSYGYDNFVINVIEYTNEDLLEKEREYQINRGIENLYNEKIARYYINPAYRKQLASSSKATHKTKAYREKMSKLKTNRIAQFTIDRKLIKVWDSALQIVEELEHTRSVILCCCNRSKKTAYGYIWRYVDDNNNIVFDGYNKARKRN